MKKKRSSKQNEILWAPWRIAYITGRKEKGCLFCRAYRAKDPAAHFVIEKKKDVFSIINTYPYNNGHIMVAPRRHVADLDQLSARERSALFEHVVAMQKRLKMVLGPQGFNIGMNIGAIAGAGIKDHIHVHIVPRWSGDTNFMPSVAGTKVISQSLDELYEQLTNKR